MWGPTHDNFTPNPKFHALFPIRSLPYFACVNFSEGPQIRDVNYYKIALFRRWKIIRKGGLLLKATANSIPECRDLILFQSKMVKTDTLFQTKTTRLKTAPNYEAYIREYPTPCARYLDVGYLVLLAISNLNPFPLPLCLFLDICHLLSQTPPLFRTASYAWFNCISKRISALTDTGYQTTGVETEHQASNEYQLKRQPT